MGIKNSDIVSCQRKDNSASWQAHRNGLKSGCPSSGAQTCTLGGEAGTTTIPVNSLSVYTPHDELSIWRKSPMLEYGFSYFFVNYVFLFLNVLKGFLIHFQLLLVL